MVVRCHYEVLGVPSTADDATLKKAYRKLALQHHPDKNLDRAEEAAEAFRLVQQAYETLTDPAERKWYDDHRDAILRGWSASNGGTPGGEMDADDMLFDVVPYTHAGCFRGFNDDDEEGFYAVYRNVFETLFQTEFADSQSSSDMVFDFGTSTSTWSDVAAFYATWESYACPSSFAWVDVYDEREAPNRRIRRAMQDENRRARKAAKKARQDDVLALVRFLKKRDPRVQTQKQQQEAQQAAAAAERQRQAAERKIQTQQAREEWNEKAVQERLEREEADRLAGRVRLADLDDDEDEYEYSGGKKKGRRKKNKRKGGKRRLDDDEKDISSGDRNDNKPLNEAEDDVDPAVNREDDRAVGADEPANTNPTCTPVPVAVEELDTEEEDDEEEIDSWRCECCRKDFKSEAQLKNHMKSKKHKELFKKYQAKLAEVEDAILKEMIQEGHRT